MCAGYRSRKHLRIVAICSLCILGLLYYDGLLHSRYLVTLDVYVRSSIGNIGEAGVGLDAPGTEIDQSKPESSSQEETAAKPYFASQEDGNFTFAPLRVGSEALDLQSKFNICLATQTTIDRLATINLLASYWRGPVELVIFLRSFAELKIVEKFLAFNTAQCNADNEWMLRTVNVQLAYPTNDWGEEEREYARNVSSMVNGRGNVASCKETSSSSNETSLITPEELLQALMKQNVPNGPDPNFVYPQNHMRNRAKHACGSAYDWVTVLDVDIIPKLGAAEALQSFYATEEARDCPHCAFVLPVFELAKPCHYPETKRDLVDMSFAKNAKNEPLAVPFHFSFWKPAHQATRYERWSTEDLDEGPVHVSYSTNYTLKVKSLKDKKRHSTYFYEPFYIAPARIPDYPERFLGFGFTRSTQAFLSLVTGWKFVVLSPVFVTHCGIQPKVKKDDFKKVPRYQQVAANNKIYKVFVDEVLKEYADKL